MAKYIDFVFVGNQGADFSSRDEKKYLGSVTNEIVRNTKINVMFIANTVDVSDIA
jgi:nucleotide-binding universal stress UspA family protein